MCEEAQKEGNQSCPSEHNTGSKVTFKSDAVELQTARNQCLTVNQVKEVNDLAEKGVVNLVWQNKGDFSEIVKCRGDNYIIPPQSTFLMSDIQHLNTVCKALGTFDLIVMDPPWTNKSVKRKKRYYTMDNDMMLDLPLGDMMNTGCVVVVWVTNKQKHIHFVTEQLFPTNSITFLARWFWLKVTRTGQCVYDFDSAHKKPYETIIIGKYKGSGCNLDSIKPYCGSSEHNCKTDMKKSNDENGFKEIHECTDKQRKHCATDTHNSDVNGAKSDPCFNLEVGGRSSSDCIHGNRSCIPGDKRF